MNFTLPERNKLASLLNAFANKSLKEGEIEYDYEDKPYQNLFQALYNIPEIRAIYDGDILMYGVEKGITKRFKTVPVQFKEDSIEEIIKEIVTTLKHNLADHVIVVPIQSAQFNNVFRIDNLTFIPQNYSRQDKLKIIARSAKKTLAETVSIADHTEKSRSQDFLKYPLLLIKQTHQTSTVHYSSLNIAKIIIYSIRCFYYGNIHKTSKDKTSFLSWAQTSLVEASHLAIYSKENWRQNHKPLNFDVSVPFDLNWLEDKEMSKKFKNFLKRIYFEKSLDDFNVSFLNALILFNESIKQNTSISTIITMTIAESILTRNRNEKRLRISAIIPRLMKLPKNRQKQVARDFDELYQKRNNFVHSGESVSINYDFETSEPTILEQGRKIIAQLILSYPTFENIIEKKIPANDTTNKQVIRMKYWDKYVDSIFHDIIY
ncbi:HEPN domain-containing protein [Flavobacterium soli]|uniref:HEPN domain-containing protein n=1 Tax=Flavobacterium soli TaxID=344881 RepID=UPI00040E4A63|nr:HEPN domain-containing protein [Flavobacterium soli]